MPGNPFRGTAPLYLLAVSCLAGHLAGLLSGAAWPAAALVSLLAALAGVAVRLPLRYAAVLLMVFCGVLSSRGVACPDPQEILPFLDREVRFRGRVESARIVDSGWSGIATEGVLSDPSGRDGIRLDRVAIYVRNPDVAVPFPAEVDAIGRLRPIRSSGNPFEIPREWQALASGTRYSFSCDARKAILLPDSRAGSFFPGLRRDAGRWIERAAGATDGALYLRSLVTGETPAPGHPLVSLLRETGLAHLLAISGVNVTIFFTLTAMLARCTAWCVRFRHGSPDLGRFAGVAALPPCWGYVLMAGAPVPAVRSATMLTASVLAWTLAGRRSAGFAFAVALLAAVASFPPRVLSPSFLLSFGAVYFLIAAGGDAGAPGDRVGRESAVRRLRRQAAEALVAATVAFFGTLPVAAAFFQGIPAGAIGWNLLFAPVLGTAGVVGAFLSVFAATFGFDRLAPAVETVAKGLDLAIALLRSGAGAAPTWIPLPPVGWGAMTATLLASASGAAILRVRGARAWPAPVLGSLLLLGWLHLPRLATPDFRMSLVALNVGNGACHVLGFPGGGTMIVDCGSARNGDTGSRVLLPYLRSQGIRSVDVLVLTHPHEDHYGGAAALLDSMEVREIWIPADTRPGEYGGLLSPRPGLPAVRAAFAGTSFRKGGAEVIVRRAGDGGPGVNGTSLVLEARFGRFRALLPGDVESGPGTPGFPPDGDAAWTVLFLPHHGSRGADPAGWVRSARPDVAVIQNRNCLVPENLLPSDKVLALENGALTFRTDGRFLLVRQERAHRFWGLLCRSA